MLNKARQGLSFFQTDVIMSECVSQQGEIYNVEAHNACQILAFRIKICCTEFF